MRDQLVALAQSIAQKQATPASPRDQVNGLMGADKLPPAQQPPMGGTPQVAPDAPLPTPGAQPQTATTAPQITPTLQQAQQSPLQNVEPGTFKPVMPQQGLGPPGVGGR